MKRLLLLTAVVLTLVVAISQARPWRFRRRRGPSEAEKRRHFMSKAELNTVRARSLHLKQVIAEKYHKNIDYNQKNAELWDDMLLSNDQLAFLENKMDEEGHSRHKRKVIPFGVLPSNKWATTVPFAFDNAVSASERTEIRKAMQHWTDRTCLSFQELADPDAFTNTFLYFTNVASGCWSYVGKVASTRQQINLEPGCLGALGVAVHEIGHALGFWHEMTRPDRDAHVTVHSDNVQPDALSNFEVVAAGEVETKSVPYDMASVMHYGPKFFAVDNARYTLSAKDPLYQASMGQQQGLTFYDTKLANLAYCAGLCSPLNCQHGGYVDPKDCSKCRCPDGFGGQLCTQVAASDAVCEAATRSDVVVDSATNEVCIESPGYAASASYAPNTQCNWKVKAVQPSCRLQARFAADFGLNCLASQPTCLDWVEVKYKGQLDFAGPHFCCNNGGSVSPLVSDASEMVVAFRSFNNPTASSRRGFRLCFKIEDASCLTSAQTTTTSTTTTTTSPTTTTTSPTTTTTTTTSPTTTTTTSPTTTTTSPTTTTTTTSPTTTTTTSPTTTTTSPTTTTTTISPPSSSSTTTVTPPSSTTDCKRGGGRRKDRRGRRKDRRGRGKKGNRRRGEDTTMSPSSELSGDGHHEDDSWHHEDGSWHHEDGSQHHESHEGHMEHEWDW